MDIKVIITIDRKEVEEYRKNFLECNPYNPTDKEILENFKEIFFDDCREYINYGADIELTIKEN